MRTVINYDGSRQCQLAAGSDVRTMEALGDVE
jgi:hypothetical protein